MFNNWLSSLLFVVSTDTSYQSDVVWIVAQVLEIQQRALVSQNPQLRTLLDETGANKSREEWAAMSLAFYTPSFQMGRKCWGTFSEDPSEDPFRKRPDFRKSTF